MFWGSPGHVWGSLVIADAAFAEWESTLAPLAASGSISGDRDSGGDPLGSHGLCRPFLACLYPLQSITYYQAQYAALQPRQEVLAAGDLVHLLQHKRVFC